MEKGVRGVTTDPLFVIVTGSVSVFLRSLYFP